MNYYIRGNKEKADQIKAAFEKLGVASNANRYNYKNDHVLYFSAGGMMHMIDANGSWANIIKTHPDYKELELPKPHYNIANFYAGMPVLVRPDNDCSWDYSVFSRITGNEYWPFAVCNGVSFTQCIPFEGNEHLLGTTDMCDEMYINW